MQTASAVTVRMWLVAALAGVLVPAAVRAEEPSFVPGDYRWQEPGVGRSAHAGASQSYRYTERDGGEAAEAGRGPETSVRGSRAGTYPSLAERLRTLRRAGNGAEHHSHSSAISPPAESGGSAAIRQANAESTEPDPPTLRPHAGSHEYTPDDVFSTTQPPGIRDFPTSDPAGAPPEYIYLPQPQTAADREPSIWQRLTQQPTIVPYRGQFALTWLPGNGDDFGVTDANLQGTFVLPWLTGFTLTPAFQQYLFDGPSRTDLPGQVYSARVELRGMLPINEQTAIELAVAPGVYSDFEHSDSDALRILGRVVVFYATSPQTRWALGGTYLDREDIAVLPIFGVIHVPSDDVRLELVFPRPKLARRLSVGQQYERWAYLLGEFGGDAWAVARRSGMQDVAIYRDWRFIVGVEQKYANGRSWLLEAGYVFSRELEYESGLGDFDPDDTVMVRAGVTF